MRGIASASTSNKKPLRTAAVERLEDRAYFSVDLADTVSLIVPRSGNMKTGGNIVINVVVSNDGTTTAQGRLATDVSLSPNPDGSSSLALGTLIRPIVLKAGGHTTLRLTAKVPVGTAPTTYYGVATVDANNAFGESSVDNNTAVSTNTIVVQPKIPDLTGTWTGTAVVKTGSSKGTTFAKTVVISGEDPGTGKFTLTGTDRFGILRISLQGSGSITPAGAVSWASVDVPATSAGTTHVHGKLAGNTLTFTFSSRLGGGAATLTLAT